MLLPVGWTVVGAGLGYLAGQFSKWIERHDPEFLASPHLPKWPLEKIFLPLFMAGGFLAFSLHTPTFPLLAIDSLWVLLLGQIFFFDIRHRLVLDIIIYPAFVAALCLSFFTTSVTPLSSLIGAGVGLLFFGIFALVSEIAYGGKAFGWGDVKLAALIGAILGLPSFFAPYALDGLLLGIILGGILSLVVVIASRGSTKATLPYAPPLVVGALVILFLR